MTVTKTDNLISEEHVPVSCNSADELKEILSGMSWQQLSAVKIDRNGASMEGSGSTEDGFSVVYYENGNQSVTPSDPSYSDMTDILVKFYEADEAWRNNRAWNKPEPERVQQASSFSLPGMIIKGMILFAVGYAVAQVLVGNG